MYVIRTNSRKVRTYKRRRESFKVAWEGCGCGAKKMKTSLRLQQNETLPSEICEYKRKKKKKKEIQLAYTDGWKDTAE